MRKRNYLHQYTWPNIKSMIANSKADPEICPESYTDRFVVITGTTSGIGYETARLYASRGADILCINRNEEKSRLLQNEIESEFGVNCSYKIADFNSLDDTRRISTELLNMERPIDVLIHNAGTYKTKKELTSEGIESVFMVNYLSSFIMTYMLIDKLKQQEKCRIINVNSEGHRFAVQGLRMDDLNFNKRFYSGLRSYGAAKTAQLLSMLLFDKLFENSNVSINSMHPGAVKTESGKENGSIYKWYKKNVIERNFKSPIISAEALYYLGVSGKVEGISGKFFNLTTVEIPSPPALDTLIAQELWDFSIELADLKKVTIPRMEKKYN